MPWTPGEAGDAVDAQDAQGAKGKGRAWRVGEGLGKPGGHVLCTQLSEEEQEAEFH